MSHITKIRHTLFFLTGLMAAHLAASASDGTTPISFSGLPKGDRLVVHYRAAGCWSYEAAEFVYYRDGFGRFEVSELATKSAITIPGFDERKPSRIGSVKLKRGETEKIDALLDHYRKPPVHDENQIILIGPPVPYLVIQQRRGDRVVAEEILSSPELPAERPVLTFGAMLHALRTAQAGQARSFR